MILLLFCCCVGIGDVKVDGGAVFVDTEGVGEN